MYNPHYGRVVMAGAVVIAFVGSVTSGAAFAAKKTTKKPTTTKPAVTSAPTTSAASPTTAAAAAGSTACSKKGGAFVDDWNYSQKEADHLDPGVLRQIVLGAMEQRAV